MMSGDEVTTLFGEHIAFDDEAVRRTVGLPGEELSVQTNQASYLVRDLPHFLRIGAEPWVRTLVVAERTDVAATGAPQTFAVAVLRNGTALALHRRTVAAELGKRLHDGMDAAAYGEVLARYHPWTPASVDVITAPGQLAREFGYADLPDLPLPLLTVRGDALLLTFHSRGVYQDGGASAWALSIQSWEVRSWRDHPASWSSQVVARDILLHG
jgi:hypothetical protein